MWMQQLQLCLQLWYGTLNSSETILKNMVCLQVNSYGECRFSDKETQPFSILPLLSVDAMLLKRCFDVCLTNGA